MRAWLRDWAIARLLQRRTQRYQEQHIIRRKSDGALFAAGCPQNFAYAMRGMFDRKGLDSFFFYRVRIWHGLIIAAPRVFWRPTSGEFEVLHKATTFRLPRWPEAVECALIGASQGTPHRMIEVWLR